VNLAVDDENETAIMRAGVIEAVVVGMGALFMSEVPL